LASIQNLEKYHQFSQELRVASPSDQRIEYLFGAYFQTDHLDSKADSNVPVFDFFASIPGFEGLTPYLPIAGAAGFSQGEQVYSGFGSLRWNVTDRLRVNGGLRASRINKRSNGFSLFGTGTQTYGGFAAFPPDIGDLAANLFGFGNGGQSLSRSDRALMPSAGIQYQMQPEAMLYFSFSRGFKAGGINPSGPLGPAQNNEFGPEYVNAYELGLKSKWFDDTLLLNLDVFRSDYNGLQVQAIVFNPSTNTNFPETRNAAASRSQGVELETQWAMTKDLRFSADVTYLDAHYVSYPNGPQSTLELFCAGNYMLPYCSRFPNPVPPYLDLSGSPTDYAPKWSGRITVAYSIPFPRNFKLSTELSSYFTTRYFPGTGGDEYLINVGGYARLDGRLTLETLDSRWALDLIGKNLTDRVIVSGGNDLILASKEQPRNVAVQFRYRF
jgi:outer membrane receptor protein involved in Fe transport